MRDDFEIRGAEVVDVLTSHLTAPIDAETKYTEISEATGVDLSYASAFMGKLPVFMRDEAHKEQRRRLAVLLAQSRRDMEAAMLACLDDIAPVFRDTSGEIDLMFALAAPLWSAMTDVILSGRDDCDWMIESVSELPDLMNPALSLRRRKALDGMLKEVSEKAPDLLFTAMPLLVLGQRSFTGSIAASLHQVAERNSGERWCDIAFPETLGHSVIESAYREVLTDTEVAGCPHSAGTRLRCVISDRAYSDEFNIKNLYGFGSHLCLGKQISQFVWFHIGEMLATSEMRVRPGALSIAHFRPFNMPTECKIVQSR